MYFMHVKAILQQRWFLICLFVINLLGSIYGFYWYKGQLAQTEPIYYIFVPDSPTASLFFTIAVGFWIFKKHCKIIEVLAFITLIKYGVWAVAMNILTGIETGEISASAWMLIVSHSLMAVQAVLYMDNYRFTWVHIVIAAIWTLHNDVIDYLFGQMPIYRVINAYVPQVGYFTFWLSIACVCFAIYVMKRYQTMNHIKI